MFKRIVSIALVFMVLSLAIPAKANKPTANAEVGNETINNEGVINETTETTQPEEETTTQTHPTESLETEPSMEVVQNESKNFGTDITFTNEYISDGYVMPHVLYTPSTAETSENIPLIVWLHGSGEVNCSEETFFKRGLPAVMSTWSLEGFNAYILCPHLKGDFNSGRWNCQTARNYLQVLIDRVVAEYNIDAKNIIIMGHSLGGQGALYMANQLPVYFSKCIPLSGYTSGIDNKEIDIPTIGYVGKTNSGEDSTSVYYMKNYVAAVFGENSCFFINASHGDLPKKALEIDVNNNNRSDMIEWMFDEMTLDEMQLP